MDQSSKLKTALGIAAAGIFIFIAFGLLWAFFLAPQVPQGNLAWYLFGYAMGLTMIVLPCTLPLAFVIVPLSLGKGMLKGLGIAISFGLGVAITLSMYGVAAAVLGKVAIGTLDAPLELVKNWVYFLAGIFAFVFALGQVGLLKVKMPSYTGAVPAFIQKQQDYLKAFFLGLFLGNIGVGCPHPATPLILVEIARSGDVLYGWSLFFVHAVGRVLPLLLLAFLGILGINALSWLVARKEKLERATGWTMVFVAGFILVLGLFTHAWWVNSGQHTLFEEITQEERFLGIVAERLSTQAPHAHGPEEGPGLFGLPLELGNWVLVALWIVPLWWYQRKKKKEAATYTEGSEEKKIEEKVMPWRFWFLVAVSLLLVVTFVFYFPTRFERNFLRQGVESGVQTKESQLSVQLRTNPAIPVGDGVTQTELIFSLYDEKENPLSGLMISHERILHVVIIGEDLQTFGHRHAEDLGPITNEMMESATFTAEYAFPKPGKYLVAVDFVHEGHAISRQMMVDVPPHTEEINIVKDLSREQTFNGYTVSLNTDSQNVRTQEEATLEFSISKDGQALSNLEPYLGAAMHVSIVSIDLGTFIHTHGQESRFGPEIEVHVVFPFPGLYKIFGEFRHEGKVMRAEFMVQVAQGQGIMPMGMPHSQMEMPNSH